MSASAFLDRVFPNIPRLSSSRFDFSAWRHSGRPTSEGVGVLPGVTCDVDRMLACIMDVGSYVGPVKYVVESRVVPGPLHQPPKTARFYQRIKVPVLAEMQVELVMTDFGVREGFRVLAWEQVDDATERLSTKLGVRTDYNLGAWLLKSDAVGYALSTSPRKSDVGRLKFAALTKGADAGAAALVKSNIEGMLAWSRRA